jgi:cytochrome c-type biogenesis protein CcmE
MALTAPPGARHDAGPSPDGPRPAGAGPSPDGPSPVGLLPVLFAPRRRRSLGTRRQRVLAGVIIVGALCFLLFRGLTNAMGYYLTANQAVAQRAQLGQSDFRIQGTVLPGLREVGTKLDFSITSSHVNVNVVSSGSPPQLFRVGMPVVLDGHWQGDTFSSFQIMVQHGSNYVEAHPPAKGKATAAAAVSSPGPGW